MKTTKKDWIYRVILLILLAIIWDIGAALTSPIFVPQKGAVFREFFLLIQNGTMLKAFRYSLVRITVAAALSAGISIPFGCLMKICHPLQKLLYPAIRAMRFLPVTAFYPLLTMWFGIGEKMKIAFLFVASFVFMLPSVLIAMDDVSDDVIEAASIDGAGKFSTVTRIVFPIAAPSICQSFATMYAIGWTYIAVAETVNAKYGIGYLIYTSSARGRTSLVFVGILAIVIFSILFDWITNICIKKIFKWKFSYYARLLQEELDKAENLSAQFQKMKPAAEEVKAIKEKLENQLAALKRESKDVVAELKANEQVADVYSNLDRLRASTGTDKMLNATRDGLQESREKAAGAKVLYQTSREGKLDKADANTADYKVSSYLDSLKKSNPNVTTYSIPDLNTLTKSSGLNTQSKK